MYVLVLFMHRASGSKSKRLQIVDCIRMAKMPSRPRSKADAGSIAKALATFADKGPSFFKYDENKEMKKSKLDASKLTAHKDVIRALLSVEPALNFAKKCMSEALKVVARDAKWKLSETELSDWIETMTRRITNACGHVHTASLRKDPPAWYSDCGFDNATDQVEAEQKEGDEEEEEQGEEDDEEEQTEETQVRDKDVSWYVGFDKEIKQAFRKDSNFPKGLKEIAIDMHSVGDDPTSPVFAKFKDGSVHTISELTKNDLDNLKTKREKTLTKVEQFYTGEHCVTNHKILVKSRCDRGDLVSLYEQQHQKCQVKVDWFDGHLGSFTTAAEAAGAFMKDIAEKYVTDGIKLSDLYTHRDSELTRLGIPRRSAKKKNAVDETEAATDTATALDPIKSEQPTQATLKRPAAATSASSSSSKGPMKLPKTEEKVVSTLQSDDNDIINKYGLSDSVVLDSMFDDELTFDPA
jgi:hypothetical protein